MNAVAQPGLSLETLGDSAVLAVLGDSLHPELNRAVLALAEELDHQRLKGVVDIVPAYASVAVHYLPLRMDTPADQSRRTIESWIRQTWSQLHWEAQHDSASSNEDVWHQNILPVPVCYGGDYGPDIEHVAAHCRMTVDEVIARHSAPIYRVAMLGFQPGFPYLLGLDPRLETPRLASPRTRIAAGAVGIGGAQTGIYPLPSPGGWQLIGWSPLRLFDPQRQPATLLRAGSRLRFVPTAIEDIDNLPQGAR